MQFCINWLKEHEQLKCNLNTVVDFGMYGRKFDLFFIFFLYMLVAEQRDEKHRLLEDVQLILKDVIMTDMKNTEKGVKHTWLPGLTRRRAASAHRWAALITSAFRPVTGFSCRNKTQWDEDLQMCLCERTQNLDLSSIWRKTLTLLAPTTKLWATLAMKPSTWTPRSLHKTRGEEETMK